MTEGRSSIPAPNWSTAKAYENYVGRWSRLVARQFVDWLGISAGAAWLDVGCGTGELTRSILAESRPVLVVGADPSVSFIESATAAIADPRVTFTVADARALPFDGASLDCIVSGLVLNFIPADGQAHDVEEMARVVMPGGTIAAYVWDYAEGMEMMRQFWDAAMELNPALAAQDEATRFPICRPEPLRALFQKGGLADVKVEGISVPTAFTSMDDYWQPFLNGEAAAPKYARSLSPQGQDALRAKLETRLPIAGDGSIHLTARAWAVRGKRL